MNKGHFLSSLSTIELGAVVRILMAITFYFCLLNIITAYFGDYLIIYFNLEQKYPKLAKWIRYRRTFQHYYTALNTLAILIVLVFMIYVNLVVLGFLN
jgi:hypothetical protein